MAASPVVSCVPPYPYQVFLNFRGEIRYTFISHLAKALEDNNINVFIDEYAAKGQHLDIFFKEIEKSRIALAIFSELYTDSEWCLDELVKIKERMEEGKLVTIPIFYMVEPTTVKHQEGAFGDVLRAKKQIVGDDQVNKWEQALRYVCNHTGFPFNRTRYIFYLFKNYYLKCIEIYNLPR